MRTVVELDDGTQTFFESRAEGLRYAKRKEEERRHSVEYLAIAEFRDLNEPVTVFRGQTLRIMLRSVDNVMAWVTYGANNL